MESPLFDPSPPRLRQRVKLKRHSRAATKRPSALHPCRQTFISDRAALLVAVLLCSAPLRGSESLPTSTRGFLTDHCFQCHAGGQPEGDVKLDRTAIDWQAPESTELWERVYDVLTRNEMPPSDAGQPSVGERNEMVKWLQDQLTRHARLGGAVPRRLNREEYQNTIRDLFDLPSFQLPDAFPADDSAFGFDNVGEGLILSPPLMAQYLELAASVADEILPPDRGPVVADPKLYEIGVSGLATTRGAGAAAVGNRFRLVSSKNMASTAGWPNLFEARHSGTYRLTVDATVFQTDKMFYQRRSRPFRLAVYARQKTEQVYDPFGELRKLVVLQVQPNRDTPQTLNCEIELIKGEIFGLRWEDGPCYSDPPSREYSTRFFDDRLSRNRRHYAAMLELGGGTRGMTQEEYYEATVALMNSDELDLTDPRLDQLPKEYGRGLSDEPHKWIKNYVHEELFRCGPALDVTDVEIEGPFRLIEDEQTRARKARNRRFLGQRARRPPSSSDREYVAEVLSRFLPRAFRRPVTDAQIHSYVELVMQHINENPSVRIEDGLHLAVRRALVSPNFLYRALRPGQLDDFDIASRLSYFLTSSPPDDRLVELARSGKLSDSDVLKRETLRLLNSPRSENFVRSFTGQWLATRLLDDIMPDPRLLKFIDADRKALIQETELFFSEILRENHPIEVFIDPGFSYRNSRLNKIYGGNLKGADMQRVTLQRGGRQGGVLGLASVMMATANGVDTHPVLRGVWMLDNVFGTPTPEPPGNVPAIAPDTSGTTTIRAQLEAHRADQSCAGCHQRIDPLGMVLENFDPVGRWRDNYPLYTRPADGSEPLKQNFFSTIGEGTTSGPPVDAVGLLADGTRLGDVTDLKRYVLDHIDMFSRCLTEKLLVYAAGRPLSFGDRRIVDQIVADVKRDGNGFRDLIVAVVLCDSFATK